MADRRRRSGPSAVRCLDRPRKPAAFSASSRRAAAPGIGAYRRVRVCPCRARTSGDPSGIADRAERLGVHRPRAGAGARSVHPVGMVFESARVKPGRGRERISQRRELAAGVPGIDAIDGADRGEVAIGEIIGAARTKAAPQRRERGGTGARTQDQQVMRQVNERKMPRQANVACRGEPESTNRDRGQHRG